METNKLEGREAESVEAILGRLAGRAPESLCGHDLALAAGLNEDAAFARPLAESWEHACSWLVRRAIELARGGAAHALSTRGLALQRAGRAVALAGESAPEPPLVRAAGLLLARLWTGGVVPIEELTRLSTRSGSLRAHNHALTEAGERVCLRALSRHPQSCLAELARELDCLRAGLKPAREPRIALRIAAGVLGFAFACGALGHSFGSRNVAHAEELGQNELARARADHEASEAKLKTSEAELEAALDVLRRANAEVELVHSELQDSSALLEEGRARYEQVSTALADAELDLEDGRAREQLQTLHLRRARLASSTALLALLQARLAGAVQEARAEQVQAELEAIQISTPPPREAETQSSAGLEQVSLATEWVDAGRHREAEELLVALLSISDPLPSALARGRAELARARCRFARGDSVEARAALLSGAMLLSEEPGEEVAALSAYLKLVSHSFHSGDEAGAAELAMRAVELSDRRPADCALIARLASYVE